MPMSIIENKDDEQHRDTDGDVVDEPSVRGPRPYIAATAPMMRKKVSIPRPASKPMTAEFGMRVLSFPRR